METLDQTQTFEATIASMYKDLARDTTATIVEVQTSLQETDGEAA